MSAQESPVPAARVGAMSLPVPGHDAEEDQYPASLGKEEVRRPFAFGILARRTLGIILLLVVVFFWTTSNFMTSGIFADDSYSKPFLVTYVNVAFFTAALMPLVIRTVRKYGFTYIKHESIDYCCSRIEILRKGYPPKEQNGEETAALMSPQEGAMAIDDGCSKLPVAEEAMSVHELADVALAFSIVFFIANYFVAACLEYTSVGSATILSSTTSIFTLVFAALWGVEVFKIKNLVGVLCSFSGVVLIALVDLSKENNDANRGSFPHKSSAQIAMGNAMALGSAIVYGIYAVLVKWRVGNEDRVDMLTVFGFVGLFSVVLIWPGFFILHWTGFERFQLPPSRTIWTIVIVNSVISFVSDFCWAYAMLLTSPTIATVGLSLSIPLSLVVQMILNNQYSTWLYWVGALIVIASFLFINNENKDEEEVRGPQRPEAP